MQTQRSIAAGADRTLEQIVALLREAADPQRIILFGSHARGAAEAGSDLDLLVVEAGQPDVVAEMVRLRRALSAVPAPVDVIVAAEADYVYWADTPGHLVYEIAAEGKVLYEKAA